MSTECSKPPGLATCSRPPRFDSCARRDLSGPSSRRRPPPAAPRAAKGRAPYGPRAQPTGARGSARLRPRRSIAMARAYAAGSAVPAHAIDRGGDLASEALRQGRLVAAPTRRRGLEPSRQPTCARRRTHVISSASSRFNARGALDEIFTAIPPRTSGEPAKVYTSGGGPWSEGSGGPSRIFRPVNVTNFLGACGRPVL